MPESTSIRRQWDTGLIRPRRPLPRDFRERYLEMGWDGIEDHYRTNWRCIRRWIAEAGGDELKAARAEVVKENGHKMLHVAGSCPADRTRRRRYVLGQTLYPRK